MDLHRDLFTVRADRRRPSDFEMVRAVRSLGFVPTIMGPVKPRIFAPPKEQAAGIPPPVMRALQRARAEGKLVLLDFHASWCGPCKRMNETTWPHPALVPVMAGLVFVKVDTDLQPGIARHYKVAGLPDARLLDRAGKQLLQLRGYKDAETAKKMLGPFVKRR